MKEKNKKKWDEYAAANYENCKECNKLKDKLDKKFSSNYLQPKLEQIEESKEVKKFIKSGKLAVVVPMKENGPVIEPFLSKLSTQIPNDLVCVINDRSNQEAVDTVKRYKNIVFIDRDEVLDALDWKKLLKILNLKERPYGKGMTVLAGYLVQHFIAKHTKRKPLWLAQHDAELSTEARHHNIRYLVWGLLNTKKKAHHLKIAKYGRNNEITMAVRSSLLELRNLPFSVKNLKIRRRAKELFNRLSPLKWMITGQFALSWERAMERPFATGYLEETLTSAFIEDRGSNTGEVTVQVVNPNPCLDGENGFRKEMIILQTVSNFVFTLALVGKSVDKWTVKDISRINRKFLNKDRPMAFIPNDENPVYTEVIPQEKIIPSVNMLLKNNLVNEKVMIDLVEKHI